MNNNAERDLKKHVLLRSNEILMQKLDGEAVLLNLDNEHYYGLNELGVRIWELLEEYNSFTSIIDALLEEYDVAKETLENDLIELLQDLEDGGLINVKNNL